jgi:hypothetical protein
MRAKRRVGRRLPGDRQAETRAEELVGGDDEESRNNGASELAS